MEKITLNEEEGPSLTVCCELGCWARSFPASFDPQLPGAELNYLRLFASPRLVSSLRIPHLQLENTLAQPSWIFGIRLLGIQAKEIIKDTSRKICSLKSVTEFFIIARINKQQKTPKASSQTLSREKGMGNQSLKFLTAPMAYTSSQSRDQTHITAVTTPDP